MNLSEFQYKYQSQLIEWRRHLHANPELSWEEINTTNFIESELRKIGIINIIKPLKTGLIAIIESDVKSEKCVALRADIDALPILEQNDLEFKSKNDGVMHACGHDVHSTCLLGAAKFLFENKNLWQGSIKLIFQPSEEKQPSGAEAMIKAGVLDSPKVDKIFGLHVTPELETGKLGFHSGPFMASADEIYLTIIGKGGHGASPHLCIDPIVMSANIIIALQQLVSRYADPKTPTVLTFGDIQGHGATNIIPDRVFLKGTLRTFDEAWRQEMKQQIKSVCEGISRGFGGDCIVDIPRGLPFVNNEPGLTTDISNIAASFLGEENVIQMPIRMGAEDFSYYGHHCPSSFFRLGTGNAEKGTMVSVHNSTFLIDEDALSIGAYALSQFAIKS
jgi:amidohydrolase